MAFLRSPQNPGLGGIDELTSSEETFVQNLAGLSYVTGDILYYNGTVLTRLAIGSASQVLNVSNGIPTWASVGSGTVTSVSVVTANGVSGSVATSTTTPAITLTLGAITPSAVQISGLTASQIVGTDASKNLVSLAVATYPSLTELTYLKGVTSALQTQIDAKGVGTWTDSSTSTGSNKTFVAPVLGAASATSLATSAATPLLLTNGQIVNVALTAQTVGATTLTIPNFASVVDTFAFVTLAQTLSNKTFIAPALGTPASGVATNLTGTAASLTAGNVTTNANLTGHVTSTGNAAILGSFTIAQLNTAVSDADVAILGANTFTGVQTLTSATPQLILGVNVTTLGSIKLFGNTSGDATIQPAAAAGTATVITLPAVTSTLSTLAGTETLTNKTLTSPVLTTPALGTPASGVMTNVTGVPAAAILAGSFGAGAYVISTSLQAATLEVGHATDTTLARVSAGVISVEGVTIPTISSTSTITNKRIEPRIVSAASYTTDTGTSLDVSTTDIFVITAQAGALLFNSPGGTPVQGQALVIRIKDNATARALTWNAVFRAMGTALPSTTVASKTLYLGFFYNSTDTKFDLVASAQES